MLSQRRNGNMMSIETIVALSKEAGRKARRLGRKPQTFASEQEVDEQFAKVPNLGDYAPKGWRHLEGRDLFVDKSGFGAEDELALTVRGYKERVKELLRENPGYGFGIIEEGQFQIYVGVFERTKGAPRKRTVRETATPLPPIVGERTEEGVAIPALPLAGQLVVVKP